MAKKKQPTPTPDDDPGSAAEPTPPAKPRPKSAAKPRSAPRAADQPRAKALTLLDQATRAADPRRRATLARQAIEADPDCSLAYLLLADQARTRAEEIELLTSGVAAAERELGPEEFAAARGSFWLVFETRPYMRLRARLADALWAAGRRPEAVDHLLAMLDLNPGDNQGIRYNLTGQLLVLDRLDDLDRLLDRYDESSANWNYTRALLAYRREGDSPRSRELLASARGSNPHVPDFLTGTKVLPSSPPPMYQVGQEDEAILYAGAQLAAWKGTAGALAWLRSLAQPKAKPKAAGKPRKKAARGKAGVAAGPSPDALERLGQLTPRDDVWQVDFRQFERAIEVGGEQVMPWLGLVASLTEGTMLGHTLVLEELKGSDLWDLVARAMEEPAAGPPMRPGEVQVRPDDRWTALAESFEALGVTLTTTAELDEVEMILTALAKQVGGQAPPGLLDMPGVKAEAVARLFRAAAEFYRRRPWRAVGFEAILRVECDRFDSGPWYGVLMGQSGLTTGLALYENLKILRRMMAGQLNDEQGARQTVALTITFDEEMSMADADLKAIKEHDWPIAAPEAYPSVFRKERGMSMRPPLAWEIDLLTACLETIPAFVASHPADDRARYPVTPPSSPAAPDLTLSWLGDKDPK